jgi:hypothetical protein
MRFESGFYKELSYRLRQLDAQNLARQNLYSNKALKYRFRHTPPSVREERQAKYFKPRFFDAVR